MITILPRFLVYTPFQLLYCVVYWGHCKYSVCK